MADDQVDHNRLRRLEERLTTSTAPALVVHLTRAVTGAEDPNLSHAACQARLPTYVADEAAGLPASERYPDVKRHLDLCADCEAEYLDLLEVALLELTGQLAAPPHTPKPDLSFLPQKISPINYVRALAQDLIRALQPDVVSEFPSAANLFFERVTQQGGRLVPALADWGEGASPDVILLLTATQLTTQSLIDLLAHQDIPVQIASGQLQQTALEQAERSARQAGLKPQAAREFAQRYAALITRDPDALQALSDHPPA